ncbi:MAG: WYL domain-containing protein [Prevotella sp.]|nr:WYL domain-containing protein [Prevotella sp.]
MYQSNSIRQCLWVMAAVRERGRITLRELGEKWVADGMGNTLHRSAFNRCRDKIFQMFGLMIECDEQHRYYVANPQEMDERSIESWLLSTMTVNTALADSAQVKERIVLESVPEGEQYLPLIIRAIKHNRRLHLRYQRFGCEVTEKTVEPYVLKLWGRRWYLLVFTGRHMATYSLDRLLSLEMTEETFRMPADFSAEQYFGEFYGVLTDETVPLEDVVVRAYGKTAHYLRTLPLHPSQRVVEATEEWTDYGLRLRPTADFVGELLKYDDGVEVLQPASLRLKICEKLDLMVNRY